MRIIWPTILLVACGGGGSSPNDAGGNPAIDARHDPIDAATLVDAAVPTGDAPAGACNPVTQTGCNAGDRCTEVTLQETPQRVTSIQCVPDGTVAIGGACTQGTPGQTGFDNCLKGGICVSSECKATCDPQQAGVASGCDAVHSCSRYNGLFTVGGTILYGACDPQCDPLTQRTLGSTPREACGSTSPAAPTSGCYRTGDPFETFSCANAGDPTKTDRQVPATDDGTPSGNAFINGCAAGFMPLFFESGTVQETRCTGSCVPGEIDNTAAHAVNAQGVPTGVAKLVGQSVPRVGDGLCLAGKKGSGVAGKENCVFVWPFLTDANGNPGPSTFNETLGFCFAFGQFQYDSDGDAIPDKTIPDCKLLPPRTPGDTVVDNDAADFGCQLIAHSSFVAPVKPGPSAIKNLIRIGNGPGNAVRHLIR
ncbi:MAG: hypothetical protein H6Q90_1921 [Deltaproteobacteria bacterium]|nr:hypothetical protein [Deltaproteobacteria bacterium]